jgi:hypothetical protein
MEKIIVLSFATWFISKMIVEMDGPFKIFYSVREFFADTSWSPLHCIYCTGLWVAFVIGFFESISLFEVFALAGVCIMIDAIFELMSFNRIEAVTPDASDIMKEVLDRVGWTPGRAVKLKRKQKYDGV